MSHGKSKQPRSGGVWRRLFPVSTDFYAILLGHARAVHEGILALRRYMETGSIDDATLLRAKEKEADEYRRKLRSEVMNAFSTPVDREDLFVLSRRLDEIINYAKHTLRDMQILKIRAAPTLVEMSDVLVEGTQHILDAIRLLPKRDEACHHHARAAKNCENDITKLYPRSLTELFDLEDLREVMKQREVLSLLNTTADRLDEAADAILHIVVKEA